jgi:hypothetical protein
VGLGYAFAGGLTFAASVFNLLMPAFTLGGDAATDLEPVMQTLVGISRRVPRCGWTARG